MRLRRHRQGTAVPGAALAVGVTAALALLALAASTMPGEGRTGAPPEDGDMSLVVSIDGTPANDNASANNPFGISGGTTGSLAPGMSFPLDLALTNPNNAAIRVTALAVALGGIDPAHATACPASTNYAVTQFTGSYPLLVVPAESTRTLSQLGIPQAQLPRVSMRDTSVNQNACKGAVLTLTYSGSAQGGEQ